jgi:hypothetical protein
MDSERKNGRTDLTMKDSSKRERRVGKVSIDGQMEALMKELGLITA